MDSIISGTPCAYEYTADVCIYWLQIKQEETSANCLGEKTKLCISFATILSNTDIWWVGETILTSLKGKVKEQSGRKKSDTALKPQLHLYNAVIVHICMGWAELGLLHWMAG